MRGEYILNPVYLSPEAETSPHARRIQTDEVQFGGGRRNISACAENTQAYQKKEKKK